MENQNLVGEWSPRRPLTNEELQVFEEISSKLLGVRYTPLEVSTQLVSGVNYRFMCIAEVVSSSPKRYYAEIGVYKPLLGHGEPCITEITRIQSDESSSGER